MSLRAKTLEKTLKAKRAKLTAAQTRKNQLITRASELEAEVDRAETMSDDLIARVDQLEADQAAVEQEITQLEADIAAMAAELEQLTGDDDGTPPPADDSGQRGSGGPAMARAAVTVAAAPGNYRSRSRCFSSRAAAETFYQRSEVKTFLQRVRQLGSQQRAVTGAELSIPTVMLDLLRDNLGERSKLINKVRFRAVRGNARQNVLGKVPEGVWTEMCAKLNELEFQFTQIEMDGYKVGGFIAICNATLADSDYNLGEEIMDALLRAIGVALDKAIVYGKGGANKMPVGFVTRLAQTSQPDYWGANQGEWTDLHTANILQLDIGAQSGVSFFQTILAALGKAKPDYAQAGNTLWIMNRATHLDLMARALSFNAAGALVAGLDGTMPVEGGEIIELEFMPDYEIAGGYGDLYLAVEREGATVARSEHVKFLDDQTVFKATARYDGQPILGEGFVVVNYNNVAPTTAIDFATDYANAAANVLIATAAAGSTSGTTVVTVQGVKAAGNRLMYNTRSTGEGLKAGDRPEGYSTLTSGTTKITAATGTPISIVEVDGDGRVVSVGAVTAIAAT